MRSKHIAFPGAAVTALLLTTLTACTADQSVDPPPSDPSNLASSVSPSFSSPSASPSLTPSPTTTPAGNTDLIRLEDVDDVTPYVAGDACEFPVSVTTKSKDALYDDDGDQVVALYAAESAVITNTGNQKVFDATGDTMITNNFTDGRSQADTLVKGVTLVIGDYTLPGEDEKKTGIIFVNGEVEATQHNMFSPDHWVEFTKFTGTPVDVCNELK